MNLISTKIPSFPGANTTWIHSLQFTEKNSFDTIPVYRVMDCKGNIINDNECPKLSDEIIIKMYKDMRLLNIIDKILYESQRQGRISFYMTNYGEEATHIGSAAALSSGDIVYGQYREAGVLLWRGFNLQELIDQCYGNKDDTSKGKQMPVHYGSKELNFITISSPLGTQMPQAVGSAYSLRNKNKAVICYFGEGAASEGDAHGAFNFSATLECPIILFCRNNGYAISTPVREQYKGDGIAVRGPPYGIHTLRVDGNDVFAVYNATKAAKEYAISQNKPVLIEALTYRVGDHSTSDDSSAYRSPEEVTLWTKNCYPTEKLRYFMETNGIWSHELETKWIQEAKEEVLRTFNAGDNKLKPKWIEMFDDVYKYTPNRIMKQRKHMVQHVRKHNEHYPIEMFE